MHRPGGRERDGTLNPCTLKENEYALTGVICLYMYIYEVCIYIYTETERVVGSLALSLVVASLKFPTSDPL